MTGDPPSRTFAWTATEGDGMSAIDVPFDQRAVFGKAQPPVVVTIDGYAYRSTISVMGGHPWVPLRASHRTAAGVVAGRPVQVTLTLDTAPRTVDPPADLATAIDAAGVRAAWDKASFTRQKEWAAAVVEARRPETRDRRIAAAVDQLRQD